MAEHVGIVVKTDGDNYAQVVTDRKGACGGCHSNSGGCHSCLAGAAKMESRVANPVHAEAGDLVKVHLSSTSLFTGAAILYLMPVIGLLAGTFFGLWIATILTVSEATGSVLGAIFGLGIGFAGVIASDRNPSIRRRIMPTITGVISSGSEGIHSGKNASCCG